MELLTVLVIVTTAVSALCLAAVLRTRRGGRGDDMLREQLDYIADTARSTEKSVRYETARLRDETRSGLRENREETAASLNRVTGLLAQQAASASVLQRDLFSDLMEHVTRLQSALSASASAAASEQTQSLNRFQSAVTAALDAMRGSNDAQLADLRRENTQTLADMRATIDNTLEKTLEKRFDASFQLISGQLEQVHRGLGEMHELAAGVGDLRRVLSNVKTRGTLGEVQLEAILGDFLAPEQFVKKAHVVPGSAQNVEFAIRLPGREEGPVLLPVDSKFPLESYERLQKAQTEGDAASAAQLAKQFETAVRKFAKDIRDKYIVPPHTTEFALMFLPAESLYAEVLSRPGLASDLQHTYHVTPVGPASLVAFLSSLQMGFRTLAIEKRTSEVWELLGGIKTEFGMFAESLERVRKKLQEAANAVEQTGTRTRVLERRLRAVEQLPGRDDSAPSG